MLATAQQIEVTAECPVCEGRAPYSCECDGLGEFTVHVSDDHPDFVHEAVMAVVESRRNRGRLIQLDGEAFILR
jgi:hypothetical protein